MGELIADGEASLIHHLVGVAAQGIGCSAIRDLASEERVPPNVLAALVEELRPRTTPGSDLARTVRVEFACVYVQAVALVARRTAERGLFEALLPCVGPFTIALGNEEEKEEVRDKVRAALPPDAMLDVPGTIELGAGTYGRIVRSAERPWRKREAATDGGLPMKLDDLKANPPGENAVGKLLAGMLTSALDAALNRSFRCSAGRAATRALVALRLYEMRHGRLPESLGALVDEGIVETVPVDPFSGEPLRYSRERRVVWSVGPDGEDDGGWLGEGERGSFSAEDYVLRLPPP
jgi:hypothetical protein